MEMYDDKNTFEKSFKNDDLPEEQIQARWAELIELKKVIHAQYILHQKPICILDLGIGDARVARHLAGIPEIWNMIENYDGLDNAQACVDLSNKNIAALRIDDKAKAYLHDATQLNTWNKKYHLVISTWFTPGNFYPINFPFDTYKNAVEKYNLFKNEKFETVFYAAYQMLYAGGEIVLGSCYVDTDENRKKQESFYKKLGMNIITDEKDNFTATEEKFWSQRFTKERLENYFHFVSADNIIITPLDTYNFAVQVRIKNL